MRLVYSRILGFKLIYYISSLSVLPATLKNWLWRCDIIQDPLQNPLQVEEKL